MREAMNAYSIVSASVFKRQGLGVILISLIDGHFSMQCFVLHFRLL